MKKTFFALALMAVTALGGLAYESAGAAQNTNSSMTSMGNNMGTKPNMGGRRHPRHGRRHGRRHRRGTRKPTGNANQ
jgi:hypothetical protein